MDYKKLADLLFPNVPTREEIEVQYPKRNLKEGAFCTKSYRICSYGKFTYSLC